jgi:serine/threonine protein kinase
MIEPLISPLGQADPRRLGRHTLIGVLGEGGMGRVYLGVSPSNSQVAVKVMHPHIAMDPAFRERFNHEVAVARRVSSPFTANVLDSGVEDGTPWLATEYIPGPTLHRVVTECGPLPDASIRLLAAGLARALQDIHARHVVHRDLKPANVICSPTGPRVIDFGIARALDSLGLTGTGYVFGSLNYMSYEQLRGEEVTGQSDVYSLGALLMFAATGRPPQPAVGRTAQDLRDVPPGPRPLLSQCLRPEPAQRCTVGDIIAQCDQAQDGLLHDWLPRQINDFVRAQARDQTRFLRTLRDDVESRSQPPGTRRRPIVPSYPALIAKLTRSAEQWPFVRQRSLRIWSNVCLTLAVVALVEVVSRTPQVEAIAPGYLPWLSAVQSIRATIVGFTSWLPNPLGTWTWAAASATGMDRRLAGSACLLVILASIARRSHRDHLYQVAFKTIASYAASLIMIMMMLRLVKTGFTPIIHIAEYLRLWALLALAIAAALVFPIGGRAY